MKALELNEYKSPEILNLLKSIPPCCFKPCLSDKYSEKSAKKPKNQEKKVILCAFCSSTITDANQIISVNGSHQHVFANPHGIIFETGCFKMCDGCIVEPIVYSEFSWFHGYNWQIAGCRRCHQHLGWFFISDDNQCSNIESYKASYSNKTTSLQKRTTSTTTNSFYCLILENLIIPK